MLSPSLYVVHRLRVVNYRKIDIEAVGWAIGWRLFDDNHGTEPRRMNQLSCRLSGLDSSHLYRRSYNQRACAEPI